MKNTGKKRDHFWRKLMNNTGIFIKLLVVILLISILPGIALTVYSTHRNITFINSELTNSYNELFDQYTADFSYRINYHEDIVYQLTQNPAIQNALIGQSESSVISRGQTVSKEISRYMVLAQNYGMDNCIIYSTMSDYPIYHYKVTMLTIGMKEDWYSYYQNRTSDIFYYTKKNGTDIMSFTKPVICTNFYSPYYSKSLGLIKYDVIIPSLFAPVGSSAIEESNYGVIILDKNNTVVFSNDTSLAEFLPLYYEQTGSYSHPSATTVSKDAHSYIVFSESIGMDGLKAVLFFSGAQFNARLLTALLSLGVIVMLSTLFAISFAILFSKNLSERIHFILRKMKLVEQGELNVYENSLEGQDEIATIDSHFNSMVTKLVDTMNRNHIAELEKKDAELKALQLQINPHFLYNTLETISSLAMENGVYQINDISERLGELFRYATNKENHEFASVEQEVRNTENYIYIQRVRFPSLFDVYYNIDEEFNECLVPRFILQPLVENAILHGFKEANVHGALEISVTRDDRDIVITVADDGIGMSAAQLKRLRTYIDAPLDTDFEDRKYSIGIKNVHLRVKYCYGDKYGLTITARAGQGTSVSVRVPMAENPSKTIE